MAFVFRNAEPPSGGLGQALRAGSVGVPAGLAGRPLRAHGGGPSPSGRLAGRAGGGATSLPGRAGPGRPLDGAAAPAGLSRAGFTRAAAEGLLGGASTGRRKGAGWEEAAAAGGGAGGRAQLAFPRPATSCVSSAPRRRGSPWPAHSPRPPPAGHTQ